MDLNIKVELEYLAIYSEKCLKCSHFVEGAKHTYTKCHFSHGNDFCPAKEVKILVTGRMRSLKRKLSKARSERNPELELEVWNEVAKQSNAFKVRFYKLLEES